MEKILTPYDKEYMKMSMLKHEETFKEQVYELHRLYQIQKQLMKNIASTRASTQNQKQVIINAHQQKHHQNLENLEGKGEVTIEDESEIELTLGPSSFNKRRKLETPLNSDSGASFSSSSSGSNLQLKKIDRAREGQNRQTWEILDRRDSNPGFLSGTRNISSGEEEEEELRQDRLQQSPWLFQVLSLNMT
ncbi:hypothetical protein LguiA_017626 [Lonicera macranthoides]